MALFKKALLIYPPSGLYMRDDRCQAPVVGMTAQPARPPLDLAYMASVLEGSGFTCKISDYPQERRSWQDLANDLKDFRPGMLVLSTVTPTVQRDLFACKVAKEIDPAILTVAKGAYFLDRDREIMEQFRSLDVAIRGECESAMHDLATQKDLSKISGITYRNNGSVIHNPDRPFLEDLNSLPRPARHLLNNSLYRCPDTKEPITVIETARGCPYACIFCPVKQVNGDKVRTRSPARIADEIEECVKRHKIRNFFFRADTFTLDKQWVIGLCREIVRRNLKVRWGTNSRVDSIDEEMLAWMKKSGCWILGFGIESGDQDTLNKINKQATLEDARRAVRLCRRHRIKTYLLFIIGFPWEDKARVHKTIAFSKELKGDFVDFNIAYPLPGTAFYEMAKTLGLFREEEMASGNYIKPIVRTGYHTTEELSRLRRKAILSFYCRPAYVMQRLLENIGRPRSLISYIEKGFRLLGAG
ncbi:MAG: radical SAM protein [Candidatus Omnitrophica bacterium]|nr:radical SAM protein [Candidatus Omnitrophota bacterium]